MYMEDLIPIDIKGQTYYRTANKGRNSEGLWYPYLYHVKKSGKIAKTPMGLRETKSLITGIDKSDD